MTHFSNNNRVLIQGIFEPLGTAHTSRMRTYGTQIVAGVHAGCGGQHFDQVPVFDLVEQAIATVGPIDTSILFMQPYRLLDAALEAIAAGIRQIIIIPEGMPPLDMVHLLITAEATETLIVGPNCPGIIVPGQVLLGTHPGDFYTPGVVGLISRSGTLTHEIALELTEAGLGQSISVGIGSDPIIGSSFAQWLQILDEDDQTEAIVLIGEIGGDGEEVAARYIAEVIDKPVVAYIAGHKAPEDIPMGHASTILAATLTHQQARNLNNFGTAQRKTEALKQANVEVTDRPSDIPELVRKVLTLNNNGCSNVMSHRLSS